MKSFFVIESVRVAYRVTANTESEAKSLVRARCSSASIQSVEKSTVDVYELTEK